MSFRVEEKLHINKNNLLNFLEWLERIKTKSSFPERKISSIYFDNDSNQMFHDSQEGVVPRKKIRIRFYNDIIDKNIKLEKKISSVEGRFKKSENINFKNYQFLLKNNYYDPQYGICKPNLMVNYFRKYFVINKLRITIDKNITYTKFDKFSKTKFLKKDPQIAVEIKSTNILSYEKIYRQFPFQKTRFSKYARGIEMINLK